MNRFWIARTKPRVVVEVADDATFHDLHLKLHECTDVGVMYLHEDAEDAELDDPEAERETLGARRQVRECMGDAFCLDEVHFIETPDDHLHAFFALPIRWPSTRKWWDPRALEGEDDDRPTTAAPLRELSRGDRLHYEYDFGHTRSLELIFRGQS